MELKPEVIQAIILALSNAVPTIFQRITGRTPSEDEIIQRVVSEKYSDLKSCVTSVCVKLLKFAEDGTYHDLKQYRTHLYPNMTFKDRTEEDAFNHEFEYRLRYLVATGFLTTAPGEYYISRLGVAFLREARNQRDFKDVLL